MRVYRRNNRVQRTTFQQRTAIGLNLVTPTLWQYNGLAWAIASSTGSGGAGAVKFGNPSGAQINGAISYDALGNVWVDLNPSGASNWTKVISQ